MSTESPSRTDEQTEPLRLSTAPPALPSGQRRSSLRARALRAWRLLTSMRTALLLLALLALAAIPGSFIPQTNVDPVGVATYLTDHPALGRLAQQLGLFTVFTSPWFSAIYLLLFVSLVGCLVPRIRLHARALRRRPPHAPRRLLALSTSTEWVSEQSPAAAVDKAASLLRSKRWRVAISEEADAVISVAAEKGYLRETGNLVFHVSLLLLLCGVAVSGLFGYKGQVLVTEGSGFADTTAAYASFTPPRIGSDTLPPFAVNLTRFTATYNAQGAPATFDAFVGYTARPGGPAGSYDIRVNHPLSVDGANVYLINDGYAVDLTVRDPSGRVVLSGPTAFIADSGTTDLSKSHGVVKVPDAQPSQLGFQGELFADYNPLTGPTDSSVASHPLLELVAYTGDLGLNSGTPQNDFVLDTSHLHRIGQTPQFLHRGQRWTLPDGDTVTFTGVTPYAVLQVAHDPGKYISLAAAILILAGLVGSLRVRRRRFWLRAAPGGEGAGPRRTVVHAAGLTRNDAEDFAAEFAALVSGCGGPAGKPVGPLAGPRSDLS
jgi:cytochrome c biogenesis protein